MSISILYHLIKALRATLLTYFKYKYNLIYIYVRLCTNFFEQMYVYIHDAHKGSSKSLKNVLISNKPSIYNILKRSKLE